MIHRYQFEDLYIVLDVESGAVHQVDELAYEAIGLLENMEPSAAKEALKARFDPKEAEEVVDELTELAAQGQLFAPPQPPVPVNARGEVKSMCLHVAHDCNLRCHYCFAETGEYHMGRALMPFSVGKAAIDFLMAHSGGRKNLEVDFFGGEPLMNWQVVKQIVAYGREQEARFGKKIRFTITTNAVAVTDEVVEFCNKEMHNVVLSIDGRKEVHDHWRVTPNGKGSFDIVLPNAKKLGLSRQELGLDYYVRGTFTRRNLDFSKDVEFLADQGFEQISIEPVVLPDSDPASIREEDMPQVFSEYEKLADILYTRRHDGRWLNFFHYMLDLENGPCLAKRMTGCAAGNEYVAVTPQGDIYPCHQFVGVEGFKMGSVLTGEFDSEIQKRFAGCTIATKPQCAACWAKYYCSGGCAANANNYSGAIEKPYEPACKLERKRLECAIALYIKERGGCD